MESISSESVKKPLLWFLAATWAKGLVSQIDWQISQPLNDSGSHFGQVTVIINDKNSHSLKVWWKICFTCDPSPVCCRWVPHLKGRNSPPTSIHNVQIHIEVTHAQYHFNHNTLSCIKNPSNSISRYQMQYILKFAFFTCPLQLCSSSFFESSIIFYQIKIV